jgi:Tol biopolymer transport system component
MPDGRLVYADGKLGAHSELWVVDRDGKNRRQLTHTNNSASFPSVTASGNRIVFAKVNRASSVFNIWVTDPDGKNSRQITAGAPSKWWAEISSDGKWLTYYSRDGAWKMPLNGGNPVILRVGANPPVISPDGRWVAFETQDIKNDQIEIVALDGNAQPRFLPFINEPQVPEIADIGPVIRWTADGRNITYVRTLNGVSNLWAQPIDGTSAKQLTHFDSMIICDHDWSRDGKYLVIARGNFSRDAVMLTDLR